MPNHHLQADDVLDTLATLGDLGWVTDILHARDTLRAEEPAWEASIHRWMDIQQVPIELARTSARGSVAMGHTTPKQFVDVMAKACRMQGVPEDFIWSSTFGAPFGTMRTIEAIRKSNAFNMVTEGGKVVNAAKLIGGNNFASGEEISKWIQANGAKNFMNQGSGYWLMTAARPTTITPGSPTLPPAHDLQEIDPGISACMAIGMSYPEAASAMREHVGCENWATLAPSARMADAIGWMQGEIAKKVDITRLFATIHQVDPALFPDILNGLEGQRVCGSLDLSQPFGRGAKSLPDNLSIGGNLHLEGSSIVRLGRNLHMDGDVHAFGCAHLVSIGPNLSVDGGADFGLCLALSDVGDLARISGGANFGGCSSLHALPDGFRAGNLWLAGAIHFHRLPEHLSVAADLCMEQCPCWDGHLPVTATVGHAVYSNTHPCSVGPNGELSGGRRPNALPRS